MKVFKFIPPYKDNGRTAYIETMNRAGVYIIKENNKVVYVGMSSNNLYRTLYRHFETWNHRQQEVITYKNRLKNRKYTVRVILCTPAQAYRLEKALVLKINPRDNDLKYKGYQLNAFDYKTLEAYKETPPIEVPF